MNKIYKVIWSKVKHQYVVVSELAHSNGKQSRTAKRSLRSRIAALVVCGAIAAFGVFGMTGQQAFAAADDTNPSQYIAIKYDNSLIKYKFGNEYVLKDQDYNDPRYVTQELTYIENGKKVTATFLVRKGYTLEAEYGERHDNSSNNLQISAYKNANAPSNADEGLLKSTQVTGTSSEYKTLVGQSLIDTSAGLFGGTVNTSSTEISTGAQFFTKDRELSYSKDFKKVEWNEAKKIYQYDNGSTMVDVPKQNVYVIGGKPGVFVVDNKIVDSTIFGKNNEILTTAQDENGTYYSMWSAEIKDPDAPITLTKSSFEQAMKYQQDSIKIAAGNDIEKIVSNVAEDGNGGSIDLLRQGEYDIESGQYSTEKPRVNGTLSITSTGGTGGDDVAIQFQADGSKPFTVDAGSKVEASKVSNGKVTQLKINGNPYDIGGGSSVTGGYVDEDGNVYINQEGDTPGQGGKLIGKITVSGANGLKVTANRIDGNKGINYEVSNNLTVNSEAGEQHKNGGNWTITDSQGEEPLTLTNTTLESGTVEKQEIQGDANGYGSNYVVKDTDGNEATLNDVASATKLKEVAGEAGKHTTIQETGKNVTVVKNETEDGHLDYTVDLNDDVTLDGNIEDSNKINLSGTEGTIDVVKANGSTNINGGIITVSSGTGEGSKAIKIDGTTAEITGLSNTTLGDGSEDSTFAKVGRAATEEQLQAAMTKIDEGSYKGWNVTTNKGTKTAEVASDGNVDFSNNDENIIVGQDGTNLTFDLNDNITLGDESGTRIQLNGNPQKDSMISITNKDSDTVFNIAKDGTVHSDGDIVAKADSNKKYSLSEVGENAVRYNENKSTVALAGTKGTTITNVADGDVSEGSKEAVNGSQLYATNQKVDAGWVATDGANKVNVNPDNNTLKFTGDDKNNITVTAATDEDTKENSIKVELSDNLNVANVNASGDVTTPSADGTKNYSLKNIGKNTEAIYGTKVNGEYVTTVTGTLAATTIQNTSAKFRVDESGNVAAGKVIINATGDISGLSNTTWNGTTNNPSRAATEGQLQQAAAASKTTLSDGINTTVTSKTDTTDGHVDYQVNLNDNVYLGGNRTAQNSNIKLDGEKGNIQVGSNIALLGEDGRAIIGGVDISTTFDDIGKKSATITGLSNTTWDADKVVIDRAATEGQLQMVSDKVTAGWTATDDNGNKINVNPETRPTLNFASGKNITVSANEDSGEVEVSLNDNINLNNRVYINGDPEEGNNTIVDIKSSDTSKEESIFAVEDKGNGSISIGGIDITNVDGPYLAVGDGKLKFYKDGGLSTGNATGTFSVRPDGDLEINGKNSSFNVDAETGNVNAINNSGSAIMMNDDSVALNASGNGVAISDEGILLNTNGINEDIKLVTKGTSVSVDSNGTTFTNTNTNETTNIDGGTINVGDKLVVDQDGTTTIAVNDGTVMGNNTTMTVNKDGVAFSAYGNGTTVIDGQTIYAGGVVINNNGSGTINGLTNTTWDDELAKQVANSEELQGTAATQGQLQQAVSEVAEVANAGWNAKAGGNTINVKPNETLNFEGDGNITVSATGGTSNELKFGLNDNITLGDKAGQKTSTSLTLYTDPTLKEVTRIGEDGNPETVKVTGYIPESYIDDQERVDNFISTHGGFMMYATNTSGEGVFGITTDGMVHAKDVISYMPNSDSTSKDKILKYSLNDIGDIVTQIAHGQYDKTGMEYTLISDFSSQADKDKPFQPEEGERTIGLAVREDGAVVVGAVVNEDGYINDSGIRINAEKRVNKDGTTSSDNMATITGLENTTWTPPEPEQSQIATFADDTPKTSRAATESQLNDLYSSVVGYNTYMTKDGSVNIDYGHVTLKGEKKYTVTTDANGVKSYSGGVILDNVAYASGEEGNEAVNVDYLNDAIKDAVKDGPVASNEKHLDTSKTYTPDKTTGKITINEVDGTGAVTGNQLVINDVASKAELDSLKTGVGDRNYNNVTDTTPIANGDSVTTAIGKLNNSIKGVTQDVINNSISGGHVDETGKVVLEKGEGENKSEVTTDIQLTDSEVSGVTLEKDTETGKNVLTITSTDKYDKNKTSSVTVSGLEIASTDDIKDVTGVASSEDLKDAYKDADKDGNATTEYITDSESMVEADVALDHAIQDVANTSYANDMVLSNRIDSVEKRLGNVEERIDKVGAMAAAIANLRTMGFDPEAPTEIAIGVGQYKSETGIAIGVFHYPNQDFMLSASLSSSGDELMGGIGATWKLGRKSAAERAKDEEARHLEQAEEMKKLAQQEKVKAQAQRHAKLLAERQQASQKNA